MENEEGKRKQNNVQRKNREKEIEKKRKTIRTGEMKRRNKSKEIKEN